MNDNLDSISFQMHSHITKLEKENQELFKKLELQKEQYERLNAEYKELSQRHKTLIHETMRILTSAGFNYITGLQSLKQKYDTPGETAQ